MSQVVKQTLIEVSDTFKNAGLHIDKCLYSYLYILQSLRSCAIKKCRKTLMVIGPTQRTVTVDSCAECVIATVCRRIIIRNCSMCTFYLLTPSSPILLSGCDNIKFAPFNTFYINIDDDARSSGLSDKLNLWDKPIVVASNQSIINGSHWSLMDPREFNLLAVPVDLITKGQSTTTASLIYKANVSSVFELFFF